METKFFNKLKGVRIIIFFLFFSILFQAKAQTTVSISNQVVAKSEGIGINIHYAQSPGWNRSELILNLMPFGNFEHPIPHVSEGYYSEIKWTYLNGTGSGDKTNHYQGKQCLKFESNNSSGIIKKEFGMLDLNNTLEYTVSLAIKGSNFNSKIGVKLYNKYFTNITYLTTPDFNITNNWQVYTFKFKPTNTNPAVNTFEIFVKGQGTVFVDDVKFFVTSDNRGDVFSKRMVDLLKEFQPGLLRWGALPANIESFARTTGNDVENKVSIGDWIKLSQELNSYASITTGIKNTTDYLRVPEATYKLLAEYITGAATTEGGKIRAEEGISTNLISNTKGVVLEIGNEVWGGSHHNSSWATGADYGQYVERIITAMNSVPTFQSNREKIFITYSGWSPDLNTWNLQTIPRQTVRKAQGDYIGISGYLGGNLALPNGASLSDPSSITAQKTYYKSTLGLIQHTLGNSQILKDYLVKAQGKFYPFFYYEGNMTDEKYYGKFGQALMYTDYITEMLKNGYMSFPVIFNMHQGPWGILDNSDGTLKKLAQFEVSAMFNQNCKGNIVSTTANGPLETSTWAGKDYSFNKICHAAFTKDGKNFTLLLINRDYDNSHDVTVQLPQGTFSSTATVQTMTASTWNASTAGEINKTTATVGDFKSGKVITVPKHSMVVVNFTGTVVLGTETANETSVNEDISIFPNPADNLVEIKGNDFKEVTVINSLGETVLVSKQNKLDVSSLENGMYIMKIKNNNTTYIRKVIISR